MPLISNDIIIEPDLRIKDGDFEILNSDDINIQYIVYADKGQLRKSPTLGVGIIRYVNSVNTDTRDLRKSIRQELERDGYALKELDSKVNQEGETELNINATKIRETL